MVIRVIVVIISMMTAMATTTAPTTTTTTVTTTTTLINQATATTNTNANANTTAMMDHDDGRDEDECANGHYPLAMKIGVTIGCNQTRRKGGVAWDWDLLGENVRFGVREEEKCKAAVKRRMEEESKQ